MPTVNMQPPPTPPRLPGVTEMTSLMAAIIDRPKEVREFLNKYDEVNATYEEMTRKYGSLQKIQKLQTDTEEQAAKVDEALVDAQAALKKAGTDAKAIVADAHAELANKRSAQQKMDADLTARSDELAEAEAEFKKSSEQTARSQEDLGNQLEARAAELAGERESFEARLAAYDAMRAQVDG